MSDIKLFRLSGASPQELAGKSVSLEKSLQSLIERDLETFLGVRFLAAEYSTGKVHGGRIDTLGLDENGCPVIIEYKRSTNENVINQGLFYLDWLMDHRGEFELLVLKKFGREASEAIEWNSPRLICIAGDFTKYDAHAVQQINRNIHLVRYRQYGDELLLLELVNAVAAETKPRVTVAEVAAKPSRSGSSRLTVEEQFANGSAAFCDRYEAIKAFVMAMGDDVEEVHLKRYVAFKRIKNFLCVVPLAHTEQLVLTLKVDPESVSLEEGFTRDVSGVGHWGTGDLEATLRTAADFERIKPLVVRSYESS